jgi:hypothetical protein
LIELEDGPKEKDGRFKMKTLDEFIAEVKETLERFEEDWRKNHKENPEHYPLELNEDNAGLWWEFLMTFND